jgi:uncharacterized YigZ family protein
MALKLSQDQYYQVKQLCRIDDKVKGSRFIATAKPVASEAEAVAFIDEIKKEFHDATHNAFAWKAGVGRGMRYRYNDDGEPSGTAGLPILKSIDARSLSNVCVVVTRYFGGIKLGTGGLCAPMARRRWIYFAPAKWRKNTSSKLLSFRSALIL